MRRQFLGVRRAGSARVRGIETRVFVHEFETREINSRASGVAYHMGVGFTPNGGPHRAAAELKSLAQPAESWGGVAGDPYLRPWWWITSRRAAADAEGNATERHLCAAYELRRGAVSDADAGAFWPEAGGDTDVQTMLDDASALQG